MQQALKVPQVAALGLIHSVPHPGRLNLPLTQARIVADGEFASIRARPPLVGEHSEIVLGEIGFGAGEIAIPCAARVI
jgi:crotonobetainyl-CoA:carnitine CoA-transferase CaiB-like acyl-CoA transferase